MRLDEATEHYLGLVHLFGVKPQGVALVKLVRVLVVAKALS